MARVQNEIRNLLSRRWRCCNQVALSTKVDFRLEKSTMESLLKKLSRSKMQHLKFKQNKHEIKTHAKKHYLFILYCATSTTSRIINQRQEVEVCARLRRQVMMQIVLGSSPALKFNQFQTNYNGCSDDSNDYETNEQKHQG